MSLIQELLALGSGVMVGFTLGLIGGGGSILAVPLLLYVVGVPDPHRAIGTSALAVAANAFLNLIPHARQGNVRWAPAGVFAVFGVIGATVGSSLGKAYDGQRLLILFALLMIAIALLMLRPRRSGVAPRGELTPRVAMRLAGVGLSAGLLAGFFGIGGGFLIVPGLILATSMPMIEAVGSSLVAVGAFGSATAVNYALSGLVDWPIAVLFITGGIGGGWVGAASARRLAVNRQVLTRVFAGIVIVVALYMLAHSIATLHGG
jgi:uncharacterized membrane protein YfcA